ncbi:hypothetical protein FUAX_03640 [Fulvitalea axinellae]|uniref:Methylamine utilisation protein MauE domain-containing protein n=1 Tax=Fulvitalea axinellae TaxID=1182444 RepID=A0AAU9CJ91_9BACT|nr:hypothetical protein FUAX_03640 [Fulvitalea axinellae]
MKTLDKIVRWGLGAIFIFSGMVKLNDPAGTAIKMQEYFEVFSADFSPLFHHLIPHALPLALVICLLEVMLGWALLIRYRLRTTLWILLALIVYFGFLTYYSAAYNKVTDCGCFGDAIPLTPWQSFGKDVIFGVMALYLIIRGKSIFPPSQKKSQGGLLMALLTVANLYIGYRAIEHLPFVDFRPYKVGVNIPKAMQPSAEYRYLYLMEKGGKEYEFDKWPTDTTYKYKDMILLNPEAEPKITDFSVWNDEGDFTQQLFKGDWLVIVMNDASQEHAYIPALDQIKILAEKGEKKGIRPIILTASSEAEIDKLRHDKQLGFPVIYGDKTVLKTIIRSNPGLVLISSGTIKGKWHYNDTPSIGEVMSDLKSK